MMHENCFPLSLLSDLFQVDTRKRIRKAGLGAAAANWCFVRIAHCFAVLA